MNQSDWLKYLNADHPDALKTPVAVVCDLAWRIASANKTFKKNIADALTDEDPRHAILESGALWDRAVQVASELAHGAGFGSRTGDQLVAVLAQQASTVVAVGKLFIKEGLLTPQEIKEDRVSFRQGCRLITGLQDGPDAEKRFERVLPEMKSPLRVFKTHEEYKEQGFTMFDVAELNLGYAGLPAKTLRKPYEKTGRYRRRK